LGQIVLFLKVETSNKFQTNFAKLLKSHSVQEVCLKFLFFLNTDKKDFQDIMLKLDWKIRFS
jgi:mRNA-degrading endonuclease YafQ of YafQ-DinJ toxin-antitoxin module